MARERSEHLIEDLKLEILGAIQNTLVPVRYMSLKQASLYSGIGQKQLITLAKADKIKGRKVMRVKRADWSFDRESIDKYWHKPFKDEKQSAKQSAKQILDQIGRNR